eukprot:COSAG01_NODE_26444_length_714_cov_0.717073_1_plen_226_part_10
MIRRRVRGGRAAPAVCWPAAACLLSSSSRHQPIRPGPSSPPTNGVPSMAALFHRLARARFPHVRAIASRSSALVGAGAALAAAAAAATVAPSPTAQAAQMSENTVIGGVGAKHRVGITAWAIRDPREQHDLDATAKSFRSVEDCLRWLKKNVRHRHRLRRPGLPPLFFGAGAPQRRLESRVRWRVCVWAWRGGVGGGRDVAHAGWGSEHGVSGSRIIDRDDAAIA